MTEAEFTRQLSELSSIAADLNRESDSINDLLTRFEEQLGKLNIGIATGVLLGGGDELRWSKLVRVTDGKIEYYWGLEAWEREHGAAKAILDCSRDVRIAALEQLPDLVEKLKSEAKERVRVIKAAKGLLAK